MIQISSQSGICLGCLDRSTCRLDDDWVEKYPHLKVCDFEDQNRLLSLAIMMSLAVREPSFSLFLNTLSSAMATPMPVHDMAYEAAEEFGNRYKI